MSESIPESDLAALDQVRKRPGGRSARTRASVLEAARAELLEGGYEALSHRAVARRAEVDPATVYRRWPTRSRLTVDALLEVARKAVPIPHTGKLRADLEAFLGSIAAALADPGMLRLFHALSAAGADADSDLQVIVREFWQLRFTGAEEMVARAAERGELPADANPHATIEQVVAPVYFRALLSGETIDDAFVRGCVSRALAAAGGGHG